MWREEDDLQSMLRESVDRYAAAHATLACFRRSQKSGEGFDPGKWREMAALGWTGMFLSEAAGGTALGLDPALALAAAAGRHLIREPFVASAVIAATVLDGAQAPAARDLARALAAGEAIVVLVDQEEVGAIEPAAPLARIEPAGPRNVLNGRKLFVPAWTPDARLLVTARLDGAPAIVAVGADTAGIAAETHRMTDGTICAHLAFNGVELGRDQIILTGQEAADAVELAIARGRLALAAQLEGAAHRLLALTCDYLGQREQFGAPLAHFQAVRHALVARHLEIELAGASWRSAAAALRDGLSTETKIRISAAKARASDAALGMARSAVHFHGAFGFTEEADIGLYLNAVLRWASWLGNPDLLRQHALALAELEERATCR